MDTIELPFARILRLSSQCAEVIVREGVEMDDDCVEQYHSCLTENLDKPFKLLVNKQNQYTYTYSAMRRVGLIPGCRAIAVVAPTFACEVATEVVSKVMGVKDDYVRIFASRDAALAWLCQQDGGDGAAPR